MTVNRGRILVQGFTIIGSKFKKKVRYYEVAQFSLFPVKFFVWSFSWFSQMFVTVILDDLLLCTDVHSQLNFSSIPLDLEACGA